MSVSSFFRKISRKAPKTFEDVDVMCTRRLTVPGSSSGKSGLKVEFIAERDKTGHWKIFEIIYGKEQLQLPQVIKKKNEILQSALRKHLGKNGRDSKMNFDEAFLILRELEEVYARLTGMPAGDEPFQYYMAAYRLAPAQFRESLDDLFTMRQEPPQKDAPKPRF